MSASNYIRALINGNSPKECPPLEFHKVINEIQNYIYGLNELKEIIHFNNKNKFLYDNLDIIKDNISFEQKLADNLSNFSTLLLEIRKEILLPDKAVI